MSIFIAWGTPSVMKHSAAPPLVCDKKFHGALGKPREHRPLDPQQCSDANPGPNFDLGLALLRGIAT